MSFEDARPQYDEKPKDTHNVLCSRSMVATVSWFGTAWEEAFPFKLRTMTRSLRELQRGDALRVRPGVGRAL
jgi:hypothetical protein